MSCLEYSVTADDRIASVNEAWLSFAEENEGRTLLRPEILGRPLWDFIGDSETRHIYQQLHARVRARRVPVRLGFRCDAPDRRRQLQLDLAAGDGETLIYRVRTVAEEVRPPVSALDSGQPRSETFVTMCAWCKRVATPAGRWLEIEDAAVLLPFFAEPRPPQLTHGICEECSARLHETLDGRNNDIVLGAL